MTGIGVSRRDYETDGFRIDDLDPDPLVQVRAWLDLAIASAHPQPDAMSLATVDAHGLPSVRSVLLKGLDTGFVFFTNRDSRKGRDLLATGVGALSITWLALHRQIRAEGKVEATSEAISEDYWQTRPRGAQLAAAASHQSQPLDSRKDLERAIAELDALHADAAVPWPSVWGGFRLLPDQIEFWQGRRNRMHDRALYSRHTTGWARQRLAP